MYDREYLEQGIRYLRPFGQTCLQCGFDTALSAFTSATPRSDALRIALLLTDGNPNRPEVRFARRFARMRHHSNV